MKKSLIVFAGGILFLTACAETETKKDGEVVSAVASGSEEDQALIRENAARIKEEETREREASKNVTTLKFDKEVHDFGEIATGSENKCVFRVTNTGKFPLTIVDVGASCGCTTTAGAYINNSQWKLSGVCYSEHAFVFGTGCYFAEIMHLLVKFQSCDIFRSFALTCFFFLNTRSIFPDQCLVFLTSGCDGRNNFTVFFRFGFSTGS